MRNKLLIFASLLLFALGVEAQETPANRTRSGDAFTQVDNYLVALKRLGIPSGDAPTLNAFTSAENTAKLFFNTTDTALYVYRDDLSEWLKVSAESDGGTVTSVGLEAPTGFSINNSPITSSGNIVLEFEDGYSLPTNIRQIEWDEAFNWGDHEGLYLPLSPSSTYKKTETTDLNNLFSSFLYAGVNSDNKPSVSAGMVLTGISASEKGGQIFVSRGFENDLYFREHAVGNNFPWKKVWNSSNLTKLSDLNNDLSLQDVMDNNNSANNLKITNLADGTNPLDAVNKQQLDGVESPFEIIDVTQTAYTDIAINVKGFGNSDAGVTYQEGAIDFGVSRDSIHQMGLYSFKAGLETTASGESSASFGYETTASGESSASFGYETEASGAYSVSFGGRTEASGLTSTAFGADTKSSGISSSAFGSETEASGRFSASFGTNTKANEFASISVGRFSTGGASETSWTDGSPIIKVGNGTSDNDRKNAFMLYNDGRSEQEKDMEVTTIGQGFVLKSPDGTRWRITVDNSGNLDTEQL